MKKEVGVTSHSSLYQTSIQSLSDERLAQDWTLTGCDLKELKKYRKNARLYLAVQLCALRLEHRFLDHLHTLSIATINYLAEQLGLPPTRQVQIPHREATYVEQRKHILTYLGFSRFDEAIKKQLLAWLEDKAKLGMLPETLLEQAEGYLLGVMSLKVKYCTLRIF